jgi:hypothetical protein
MLPRDYSRRTARRFGLHCEEIPNSTLIKNTLHDPQDAKPVAIRPGEIFSHLDFERE